MGYEIPITNLADARDVVRAHPLDQPTDTVEIAALLTDELIANAMEHGVGNPTLAVNVTGSQLVVRVRDDDRTVNLAPLPMEPTRARGRGLAIVNALASAWGVEPQRYGKVVWFELNL